MPVRFYSFFRVAISAIFSLICVVFFSLQASPALADPHAVFYTDRAQEQLFYNVLAALNQADYVEPGIGTFPYARNKLLQNRAGAVTTVPNQTLTPFTGETNPVIDATHTDLPSVVTRNITLEGNDLWTAYLIQQFALETATRRSENELARVFCERGLGIIGCDTTSPYAAKEQSSAFQTNPLFPDEAVTVAANSALQSGTQAETNLRRNIQQNDINGHKPGDPLYLPRPDNAEVAALNQTIESKNQPLGAQTVSHIANSITTPTNGINPDTFTDVSIENGNPKLADSIDTADKYLDKLQQIANLPQQLVSAAQDGINKQVAFLNNITNTPSLAQYQLSQTNKTGDLAANITEPSGAQQAMIQALANLVVNSAVSQKYTSSNDALTPGNQPLLTAPIPGASPLLSGVNNLPPVNNLAQNTPEQPGASQLAANAPSAAQNGQVAGITTDQIYNLYNNTFGSPPQNALSPSVNTGSPLRETGIIDALSALTNGTYRKNSEGTTPNCAFCVQMNTILQNSNNTIGDIYCTLFPNTEACFRKNPAVSPAP